MGSTVNGHWEKAASLSTSAFIPWTRSLGIQLLTISYPACGCSGVINLPPSSRVDWAASSSVRQKRSFSSFLACDKQQKDGMMPPIYGSSSSRTRSLSA